MTRTLLVCVGQLEDHALVVGASQYLKPGRQVVIRESHGYGRGGQASCRRDDLAIVTLVLFDRVVEMRWRVRPRRIHDGLNARRVHRGNHVRQERLAAGVVDERWARWIPKLRRHVDRTLSVSLETFLDV